MRWLFLLVLIAQCDGNLPPEELVNTYIDTIGHTDRYLEIGDFGRFNELFQDATFALPDTDVSEGQLSLSLSNLHCREINIGDIHSNYYFVEKEGGETLAFEIHAEPFAMNCFADYSYRFAFLLPGSGRFEAITRGNQAATRIVLNSPDFDLEPPSSVDVEYCEASINILDVEFQGGIVASILNTFKSLISGAVEDRAEKAACDKISLLGPTLFTDVITTAKQRIDEWLEPIPTEALSPLHAETNFEAPQGVTLLNFDSTGNNLIGGLFVKALQRADKLFGGEAINPVGTAAANFDINHLLRKAFRGDGVLHVPIKDLGLEPTLFSGSDRLMDTRITLNGMKVTGLDTLNHFSPLAIMGNYTIGTELKWDSLSVEMDLAINFKSSSKPDPILFNPTPISVLENMTISMDFSELFVAASFFMPIDEDKFEGIEIGCLLKTEELLQCLLSTTYELQVLSLNVTVGNLSVPTVGGFSSPGTGRIITMLLKAAFLAFEPTLLRAVPHMVQDMGRDILNNQFLPEFMKNQGLDLILESSQTAFLDFRDLLLPKAEALLLGGSGEAPYGNLVSTVFELLNEELLLVDLETGLATINSRLLSGWTESQSGTPGRLFFSGDLVNQGRRVRAGGLDANFQLRIYDAYINNLDTLGAPLSILDPVAGEAHLLNNSATIGLGHPLQLGVRFLLGISNDETVIKNDLDLSLNLDTLRVLLTAFLKVSEKAFLEFPVKDVFNLQCWLATLEAPALDSRGVATGGNVSFMVTDFVASVVDLALNVSCIDCSSTRMPELSELWLKLDDSKDLTNIASNLFNLASKLVEGDFLQVAVDRALNDARKLCPHSLQYDPNFVKPAYDTFDTDDQEETYQFFITLLIVVACLGAVVSVVILAIRFIVHRRHRKWLASLPQSQLLKLWEQQNKQKDVELWLNAETAPLFSSNVIPCWVRWLMPVIILGNIALFLSGHLSLGASVSVMLQVGGQILEEENFFAFSMAKSTVEIWKAGARELAVIIFLLSFAWPYTKQLITLGLWFAPPTMVSVSRRGSIFLWLDALAKWSMIDVFVLVLTIVSFRVSVQSPDVDFLPVNLYSIDLLVIPKWGLYANMTAQLISQISSHFIIHYHCRVADGMKVIRSETSNGRYSYCLEPEPTGNVESFQRDNKKDRLCMHTFRRPHRGESDKLVIRRGVGQLLLLVGTTLIVLVTFGCLLPSYSVSFLGIVGVLVESGQAFIAADTEYSVFTTVKLLFEQAKLVGRAADYIGLGSLSILMLLTVLVVPVLQSVVLLVQWFKALTRRQRERVTVSLKILQAWQYAEVYLLSVLVASWQLGGISEFMINPYCRSLEGLFAELVYFSVIKPEDAQCFRSGVSVKPTFYVLFSAAILLALFNAFVVKAASQYVRDMDDKHILSPSYDCKDENIEKVEEGQLSEDYIPPSSIHTVPVLFTDRFRWFLYREDITLAQRTSSTDFDVSVNAQKQPMHSSHPRCNEMRWGGSAAVRSEVVCTEIRTGESDVGMTTEDSSNFSNHEPTLHHGENRRDVAFACALGGATAMASICGADSSLKCIPQGIPQTALGDDKTSPVVWGGPVSRDAGSLFSDQECGAEENLAEENTSQAPTPTSPDDSGITDSGPAVTLGLDEANDFVEAGDQNQVEITALEDKCNERSVYMHRMEQLISSDKEVKHGIDGEQEQYTDDDTTPISGEGKATPWDTGLLLEAGQDNLESGSVMIRHPDLSEERIQVEERVGAIMLSAFAVGKWQTGAEALELERDSLSEKQKELLVASEQGNSVSVQSSESMESSDSESSDLLQTQEVKSNVEHNAFPSNHNEEHCKHNEESTSKKDLSAATSFEPSGNSEGRFSSWQETSGLGVETKALSFEDGQPDPREDVPSKLLLPENDLGSKFQKDRSNTSHEVAASSPLDVEQVSLTPEAVEDFPSASLGDDICETGSDHSTCRDLQIS